MSGIAPPHLLRPARQTLALLLIAGLIAALVCSPARSQTPSNPNQGAKTTERDEGCESQLSTMAVLGDGDSAERDSFGVRLFSVHAESVAQVQAFHRSGGMVLPGAPAGSTDPVAGGFGPPRGAALAMQALQRGDFDLARRQFADALAKGKREGSVLAEGAALNDLGVIDAVQGRAGAARERFRSAAELFAHELQRSRAELLAARSKMQTLKPPPTSLAEMREWLDSLKATQSQVTAPFAQSTGNRIGRLVALLNTANLAASLGQRAEAEALFKQAAAEQAEQTATMGSVYDLLHNQVMGDLAVFYRKVGRKDLAQQYAAQARQRAEPAEEERDDLAGGAMTLPMWLLGEAGSDTASRPSTGIGTGDCAAQVAQAVREQPMGFPEAGQRWLSGEAQRLEAAGDSAGAMAALGRASFLASVIGSPERERQSRAALQRLALARGEAGSAILHGKLAVNASQRLRVELDSLSRQARQAFLAERRVPYASLVTSLLDLGRRAEAETVLRLLKEDEGQQLRRPAEAPRGRVPMTLAEAGWLGRLDALAGQARAQYAERQRLVEQTWMQYGVPADRGRQEQLMVQLTLDTAEQWVAGMDRPESERKDQQRQAAQLLAKPRGSRTSQEQLSLDVMQVIATRSRARLTELAAALRALPGDAQRFQQPLSADQARRAADLERRLTPARAGWEDLVRPFAREPAPVALSPQMQAMVNLTETAMGGGAQHLRRLWAIDRQVAALEAESEALHRQMAATLGAQAVVAFDVAADAVLAQGQRTLAELPAGTVAVYYVQSGDRLDALVVSARQRQAVRLTADRAALSARIARWRGSLESESYDALTDAKALYDLLWRPLEPALREAAARTVMLSLDGALRGVPFAALHDGGHWLVERHALDVYTSAASAALTARPAPHWSVAAFGASAGGAVNGKVLKPLPAVREELAAIVRAAGAVPGAPQGVLPGSALLDQAFSAAALRDALRLVPPQRPSVLHLASHFAFAPGDLRRSALLLGDGSTLSLTDLASADYRFDGIDLVTLSACSTALTGNDAFDQEVEGLGTLLQAQGAAAVLATLWSVQDGSTAAFMAAMYALRERDGLSRAEAVRQAQLRFIRGEIAGGSPALASSRGGGRDDDGQGGGWAHPYHWAPFVLMGNWL